MDCDCVHELSLSPDTVLLNRHHEIRLKVSRQLFFVFVFWNKV